MSEFVNDRVNKMVEGILWELHLIAGPLTREEKEYTAAIVRAQAEKILLARVKQTHYVARVDAPPFACSDTDPNMMCPDCLKGFREHQERLAQSGEAGTDTRPGN